MSKRWNALWEQGGMEALLPHCVKGKKGSSLQITVVREYGFVDGGEGVRIVEDDTGELYLLLVVVNPSGSRCVHVGGKRISMSFNDDGQVERAEVVVPKPGPQDAAYLSYYGLG